MEDDGATDLFLTLTPEKVLAAVEAAGLRCRPICYPLNSFENRVYEVELEDRSRVVVKFYRPGRWRAEEILEEHRFLEELVAEEVPVCAMRPFPDGTTLHKIDHIYYCVADRRGGRAPDELGDRTVQRLGMFVARMHNVAARRPADRPRLDADRYIRRSVAWLEEHEQLPKHLRRRYVDTALAIADIADRRMLGVPVHRIHADLHLGNVLFRDGLLRVLDFDDMLHGPAVQDLWLALPGRDAEARRQCRLFLDAYEQLRLFDHRTLNLIEPLRGLRLVRYTAWLARRWRDPAFQAGWPYFGTEEYWQRETEDLEEQLAVIRAEADDLGPEGDRVPQAAAGEELLTNKDYFWDWEGD